MTSAQGSHSSRKTNSFRLINATIAGTSCAFNQTSNLLDIVVLMLIISDPSGILFVRRRRQTGVKGREVEREGMHKFLINGTHRTAGSIHSAATVSAFVKPSGARMPLDVVWRKTKTSCAKAQEEAEDEEGNNFLASLFFRLQSSQNCLFF